jgi:hypothetical protein
MDISNLNPDHINYEDPLVNDALPNDHESPPEFPNSADYPESSFAMTNSPLFKPIIVQNLLYTKTATSLSQISFNHKFIQSSSLQNINSSSLSSHLSLKHHLLDLELLPNRLVPFIPSTLLNDGVKKNLLDQYINLTSPQSGLLSEMANIQNADPDDVSHNTSESDQLSAASFSDVSHDNIDHPIINQVNEADISMLMNNKMHSFLQACPPPPTPQLLSNLKLITLLNKSKVPLHLYESIQKWAHDSACAGTDFTRNYLSRSHVIKDMTSQFDMESSHFHPMVVNYLPDEKPTILHVSSFIDAVYSLLSNHELSNEDNLAFPDPISPFLHEPAIGQEHGHNSSELHHCKWYKDTHIARCLNPDDVLCPIILYMDGVSTDAFGRLGLTPLNMCLGIHKAEIRTLKESWVTLYYHPDDEGESALHSQKTTALDKLKNLHRALDVVFTEFRAVTAAGGLRWDHLKYGGSTHKVNFIFCICFVIGDTEMHDKLCGRYQARTSTTKCLCRHCDCPLLESINVDFRSHLHTKAAFERNFVSNNFDYFTNISHHPISNAFHKLDMGENPNNIHLASPGELLHMIQKGMEERVVEGLKNFVIDAPDDSDKKKRRRHASLRELDNLGLYYGSLIGRQSDRDFPRTKFKSSLFSGTKKAGHEQAGVLLNLVISMISDRGRQILLYERTLSASHVHDQVLLFELSLGLEEYLKKTSFSSAEVRNTHKAMQYILHTLDNVTKRGGMGNLLIKNHLLLHLQKYMKLWGAPRQWNSGPSESHHKTEVKALSKNTQRRADSLVIQTAQRYTELRVLRTAARAYGFSDKQVENNKVPVSLQHVPVTGTSYSIGFNSLNMPCMRWENRSHYARSSILPTVIQFVCHHILRLLTFLPNIEHKVCCFTEHKRTNGVNRIILRAHPDFRSQNGHAGVVWYDWAYFKVADIDDDVPCQILCFMDLSNLERGVEHDVSGYIIKGPSQYAVVRKFKDLPVANRLNEADEEDSEIIRWGNLEEGFFVFDCSMIAGPACVVPNKRIKPWEESRTVNKNAIDRKLFWKVLYNLHLVILSLLHVVIGQFGSPIKLCLEDNSIIDV